MQQSQKEKVNISMHVADLENARACAEQLGVALEDYILLATHAVNMAVLSGKTTVQVPPGLTATKWWTNREKTCVQNFFSKAA
ncbi:MULTISPECIES: hypothetical protein [unclassified Cupriavidus]|uniref:hypothetical protein n=1 Tax=unclassified Cupriavidus TaxID=2640874 RepID=UPI00313C109B